MFSGAIKLLDLNDYLAPAEDCVVVANNKKITIKNDEKVPSLIPKSTKQGPTKINLTDCLACSGCVTSSEKLLVEEQSMSKFAELAVNALQKFVIVSPQPLLALANHFRVSEKKLLAALNPFMNKLFGVEFVLEMSLFVELSNQFAFEEFESRKNGSLILSSECPGFVCYAEKVLGEVTVSQISKVKPPQLIAAQCIKNMIAAQFKLVC